MTYAKISDYIGQTVNYVQQMWTTKDGIKVFGVMKRSLNGNDTIRTFGGTDVDDTTQYE